MTAGLQRAFSTGFAEGAFDSDTARTYADIAASRRRADQPIDEADYQIASITPSCSLVVMEHDVRDVSGAYIEVIGAYQGA